MALFPSTVLYRRVAMAIDKFRRISVFGVWASVVLIGLAFVSVTLGVAPVADPTMFPVP